MLNRNATLAHVETLAADETVTCWQLDGPVHPVIIGKAAEFTDDAHARAVAELYITSMLANIGVGVERATWTRAGHTRDGHPAYFAMIQTQADHPTDLPVV